MVKRLTIAAGLAAAVLSGSSVLGQAGSFPYDELIQSLQEKGVRYDLTNRRLIASALLPSKMQNDEFEEVSLSYQGGELSERYIIVCKGLIGRPEAPYGVGRNYGPLELGITSADCFIDGIYGPFDNIVDAILRQVAKRRPNVAQQLDSFDGFSPLPIYDQEVATRRQKEALDELMVNYRSPLQPRSRTPVIP